jgi:hypothetical protein
MPVDIWVPNIVLRLSVSATILLQTFIWRSSHWSILYREQILTALFILMWQCIVTNFFIIKPIRCTNFPNLLQHETLHISGSSSAHHQEFIHCKLSNGKCHTGLKTAFEQDQDGTTVPSWSCSKALYKPVWHIPVPSVQWINSWWWAEELSETCTVSCRSKFGKLVHLACIIIKKFVTLHGHMNVKNLVLWFRVVIFLLWTLYTFNWHFNVYASVWLCCSPLTIQWTILIALR